MGLDTQGHSDDFRVVELLASRTNRRAKIPIAAVYERRSTGVCADADTSGIRD